MRKEDINFPIGKTRLETLGVIACAIIMGLASYGVLLPTPPSSSLLNLYWQSVSFPLCPPRDSNLACHDCRCCSPLPFNCTGGLCGTSTRTWILAP